MSLTTSIPSGNLPGVLTSKHIQRGPNSTPSLATWTAAGPPPPTPPQSDVSPLGGHQRAPMSTCLASHSAYSPLGLLREKPKSSLMSPGPCTPASLPLVYAAPAAWTSSLFLQSANPVLPQGLCTSCACCLECPSPALPSAEPLNPHRPERTTGTTSYQTDTRRTWIVLSPFLTSSGLSPTTGAPPPPRDLSAVHRCF